MHPFRPTKPMIRICGIVGRNGCIALQGYTEIEAIKLTLKPMSACNFRKDIVFGYDDFEYNSLCHDNIFNNTMLLLKLLINSFFMLFEHISFPSNQILSIKL